MQANAKTLEGSRHADRDAQFHHINEQVKAALAAGEPVISVDTNKKELVGPYKNGGREYRPSGDPEQVNVHDFIDRKLGKAVPYGVYDIGANTGWVSVGVDHDTAAFAVNSIRMPVPPRGVIRWAASPTRKPRRAELRQFAVDAAVSPQVDSLLLGGRPGGRRLGSSADDQAADAWDRRRAAGLPTLGIVGGRPGFRRLLVSYLLPASLRCQARSVAGVAGVTGKTSVQRLRGRSRASAANHTRSPGSYRTRPVCRRSTAFWCRSTSSSASFARSPRNARTARPSTRHVSR